MTITTEQVKELRDKTGVSVMQCRKALEETGGDMEKALIVLRKKGSEMAEKKSERSANDGRVFIKSEDSRAMVVTLYCETDFVAQNQDFINCGNTILETAWASGIEEAKNVAPNAISNAVLTTGENIQLGDIEEIKAPVIGSYIHFTGKNAVLVGLSSGSPSLAKDIAMHISALKPTYLQVADIKEEDKAKVIEVFKKEVEESGKPEDIKAKMLEGKLGGYFKEQTLLDQPFLKDESVSVGALLSKENATVESWKSYTIG